MQNIFGEILRTCDGRFENLPGFSFEPHYISDLPDFDKLRMHFLDVPSERQDSSQIFLCLHGQPTWCYIYRKMIPFFARHGRVVAPDLFGFGRSDKPVNDDVYTFPFHRSSLMAFIKELDLKNITLVCQDWGGVLGLTIPIDLPERFDRLIVMNTVLGTGDHALTEGFLLWRAFNNKHPDLEIPKLMRQATPHLSDDECLAYGAPFPNVSYKAGVRRFPNLVPDKPDADGAEVSRQAKEWWQKRWQGKSFMAIGMKDPILGAPVMHRLRQWIKNCPPPLELPEAGHFVQEWGDQVAESALVSFSEQ